MISLTATEARNGLTGNAAPPARRALFTGSLLDGVQCLFLHVLVSVPAWLAGAESQVSFVLPHLERRGKAIRVCWPREAGLQLPHGKTCLPELLPLASLSPPRASCHVQILQAGLWLHLQKTVSRGSCVSLICASGLWEGGTASVLFDVQASAGVFQCEGSPGV